MQFQPSTSNREYDGGSSYTMFLPGMTGDGRIHHSILNHSKQRLDLQIVDPAEKDVVNLSKPAAEDVNMQKGTVAKTSSPEAEKDSEKDSKYIAYYGNPAGPKMWYKRPKNNRKNNAAATIIQKAARGKCARTNVYIRKLENQLALIKQRTANDLQIIEEAKKASMLKMRRKVTKKETQTLKDHMVCTETAHQGANIIHFLRNENKKLREKNTKIAESILELKTQNDRLEKATASTGDNETLLTEHYEKIKKTNEALQVVVPKYQERLREMEESMETRRQFSLTEHKTRVLYVKVVGSLAELVEQRSNNKELVEYVVSRCLEIENELPMIHSTEDAESDGGDSTSCQDEDSGWEDDEDSSDSDSNDYDEYSIAVFEGGE